MGHRVCCYPSCPYITCKLDLTGVVTDLDIHGQDLKAELEVEFPFWHQQVRGHGCLPENVGLLSLGLSCCTKWRSCVRSSNILVPWGVVQELGSNGMWIDRPQKFCRHSPDPWMRLCVLAAEMSFLCRLVGLSLRDKGASTSRGC